MESYAYPIPTFQISSEAFDKLSLGVKELGAKNFSKESKKILKETNPNLEWLIENPEKKTIIMSGKRRLLPRVNYLLTFPEQLYNPYRLIYEEAQIRGMELPKVMNSTIEYETEIRINNNKDRGKKDIEFLTDKDLNYLVFIKNFEEYILDNLSPEQLLKVNKRLNSGTQDFALENKEVRDLMAQANAMASMIMYCSIHREQEIKNLEKLREIKKKFRL